MVNVSCKGVTLERPQSEERATKRWVVRPWGILLRESPGIDTESRGNGSG